MGRKRKEYLESVLFTIPAVFLVCVVFYIPFLMGIYYSLTKWNGIAKEPVFIGLENYKTLISQSSGFITSLGFTIRYTILFMILANVLALAVAVALSKKFRGVRVIRSMFFIPYIMSMTIVGFIWKFIFSQGFGVSKLELAGKWQTCILFGGVCRGMAVAGILYCALYSGLTGGADRCAGGGNNRRSREL